MWGLLLQAKTMALWYVGLECLTSRRCPCAASLCVGGSRVCPRRVKLWSRVIRDLATTSQTLSVSRSASPGTCSRRGASVCALAIVSLSPAWRGLIGVCWAHQDPAEKHVEGVIQSRRELGVSGALHRTLDGFRPSRSLTVRSLPSDLPVSEHAGCLLQHCTSWARSPHSLTLRNQKVNHWQRPDPQQFGRRATLKRVLRPALIPNSSRPASTHHGFRDSPPVLLPHIMGVRDSGTCGSSRRGGTPWGGVRTHPAARRRAR